MKWSNHQPTFLFYIMVKAFRVLANSKEKRFAMWGDFVSNGVLIVMMDTFCFKWSCSNLCYGYDLG